MRLRNLAALAAVALSITAGVAAAAPAFPATIPLPRGFQPEGIAIRGNTFYVGSIPTGAIYRGNLRTGTGSILVEGAAPNSGRLIRSTPRAFALTTSSTVSSIAAEVTRIWSARVSPLPSWG